MIKITLNATVNTVESEISLAQLLQQHHYQTCMIAVAVNQTFIPRTDYADYLLQDNDKIDVVSAMQGG